MIGSFNISLQIYTRLMQTDEEANLSSAISTHLIAPSDVNFYFSSSFKNNLNLACEDS
jgi:hypothetical protein